jgi:glutathione S-transferase
MSAFERRVRATVNPLSTAATRWWCRSSLRLLLTGHGPTARQRRLIRYRAPRSGPAAGSPPSAELMKARAAAIDALLSREREGR